MGHLQNPLGVVPLCCQLFSSNVSRFEEQYFHRGCGAQHRVKHILFHTARQASYLPPGARLVCFVNLTFKQLEKNNLWNSPKCRAPQITELFYIVAWHFFAFFAKQKESWYKAVDNFLLKINRNTSLKSFGWI